MRWRRRTDDARRTKGDPPPTYEQLQGIVDALTYTLKQQGELLRNLRSQVDGLTTENRELRTALTERTEDAGTLALELAEAKAEGICGDEAPTLIGCTTMHLVCALRHGHASEWHEDQYGSRWRNARSSTDADPKVLAAAEAAIARALEARPFVLDDAGDPDVTRPYIPECGEER